MRIPQHKQNLFKLHQQKMNIFGKIVNIIPNSAKSNKIMARLSRSYTQFD